MPQNADVLLAGLLRGNLDDLPGIARAHRVRLLILFGSTAKGARHPESDLDIGALFAGPPEDESWLSEESDLQAALETALAPECPLEVVALNRVAPPLQAEVADTGVLLYADDPLDWTWFRILAHRRYEDTEKYRRRRHQRTLAEHGLQPK